MRAAPTTGVDVDSYAVHRTRLLFLRRIDQQGFLTPISLMRNVETIATRSRDLPVLRMTSKPDLRENLDDPRWRLGQRIAVSRSIGRSPLLSEFLLYVCDKHIKDKPSDLTEQRIGVNVFGRNEGYNSNDDNIVRNYARTLRKRIEEYFATEGRYEELKLEIPRGAYVPIFYSRSPEKPPQQEGLPTLLAPFLPSVETVSPRQSPTVPVSIEGAASIEGATDEPSPLPAEDTIPNVIARLPSAFYPIVAFCVILIAIAIYLAIDRHSHTVLSTTPNVTQPNSLSDILWSQLFQKNRDTFIVPADSGLVIIQGLTRSPVSLGEYAGGSYLSKTTSFAGLSKTDLQELGGRRYTSIVDLNIVSQLSRLKEIVPERMLIRYARDLRMDDLRSGNAILLGSIDSNPWAELFQEELNFRFSYNPKTDTSPVIVNQHPLAGERPIYANDHVGPWHNTFGAIAYRSNLDGTGHVLLVGGLTMAGTQAAADFLLDTALMQPVLERARASNGTIRPFEILVETSTVAANASRPRVVSERIAPL
jgi:hypothetical protein